MKPGAPTQSTGLKWFGPMPRREGSVSPLRVVPY